MNMPISRFFTIAQVASLLSVSQRTVRRWIAAHDLLAHKFGRGVRISEVDLKTFLAVSRESSIGN
jgi:excisionase family DNA binding protein